MTRLLSADSPISAEELLPLVYDDLRRLASARLADERPGQTLQPTALVHEAWLRVAGKQDPGWNSRRHFFKAAAEAMRRILIERARRKQRHKHGGDKRRVDLDPDQLQADLPPEELVFIEESLGELEQVDPRAREVVNLRYFAGLSDRETAQVLDVSVATVERDWRFIRTFLQERLQAGFEE